MSSAKQLSQAGLQGLLKGHQIDTLEDDAEVAFQIGKIGNLANAIVNGIKTFVSKP